MIEVATVGVMQRPAVRQFLKFCIIGFSSMIIDVGISWYLTYHLQMLWFVAKTISFALAVTNGYTWNSMWTFRGMGAGPRHEQYVKFVAINIVGLVLNIGIMKSIFFLFTGHLIHHGSPDKTQFAIATAVAVVCVAVWNFVMNKKWTFNGTREEALTP
jgi:putative flippase GtrA